MSQQPCFFSHKGDCGGEFLALYDLRYDNFSSKCFPGARSPVEILLLCDDRFYDTRPPLRSTFVCLCHKQEFLKEYRPTSYKKCWLCLSLKRPFPVRLLFNSFYHTNMRLFLSFIEYI